MTTTTIYTGVTSNLLNISNGDHLIIQSGGEAYEPTISTGGSVTVSSGGIFADGELQAGAQLSGPGLLEGTDVDYGTVEGSTLGVAPGGSAAAQAGYLYIEPGGVASNVTEKNGLVYVFSGGSTLGDVVSSGGAEYVLSSGTASGTRVLSGGIEIVTADAILQAVTVSSGAHLELIETVSSGQAFTVSGLISATTAISGATVLSGAQVDGYSDYVSSGGTLSLATGAIVNSATVASGGAVEGAGTIINDLSVSGTVSGTTVGETGSAGFVFLGAGSGSGLTVKDGVVYIFSGATASSDVISSGGSQTIYSSGMDVSGAVLSGGTEILAAGGIAQSVTVSGGGVLYYAETVSSGVTLVASGTTHATSTYSGVTLLSGASLGAYQDEVRSSGVLSLGAGAQGLGIYIDSGGTVSGPGTLVNVNTDSGLVSGLGVAGFLNVETTGSGYSLDIRSAGSVDVHSGFVSGDTVSSGGIQVVDFGGVASSTFISSGGIEIVSSTGSATSDTISSGGVVSVLSGGFTQNDSVLAGGRLYLASGASVSSALVFPGGTLELQSLTVFGAQTSALSKTYTSANFSGVTLAGGSLVVDQATVSSGGVLSLGSGFVMSDVTIASGGVLLGPGEVTGATPLIDSNLVSGVALGDAHASASLQVLSGAFAISVAEAGAGDLITVSSGGAAIATVETGTGARLIIDGGAYASATTIRAGADAQVFGSAAATHLSSGAVEFVESGGVAAGIVVLGGGLESILSGGTTSIVTISSGGAVSVAAGGKLREATEIAGGSIVVSGDAIWQGAATYTLKGALSGKGDIFEDGPGTLVLSSVDTAFAGEAIISGGVIELASASGLGTAKLEFGAGATKKTLKIDAADRPASGGTFATTLIDFDSSSATYVDLTGLAFVTGATATLSGTTLTLKDGTYTAKFTLSGEGASKYSVFSDGAGGTEFRAATGSTQMPLLVHAIATFGPGGGASHLASPVSGGAVQSPLIAASLDGRKGECA